MNSHHPELMMLSGGVALASEFIDKNARSVGVEKLPEELNDIKIRDDKVNIFFNFVFTLLFLHFFLE
jgi:hypothetical protein